ncbi:MAG TPA: AMIN domain-containing protein, partial [Chroococcales cyanobacterium]
MTGKIAAGNPKSAKIQVEHQSSVSISLISRALLALSLMMNGSSGFAAAAQSITGITVDPTRQIVFEFGHSGGFPQVPHLLDMPDPNHRVILDFQDTTLDKGLLPPADELGRALHKKLPAVRGVRYSQIPNAAKPTARVVIEIQEATEVKPKVVKVEESGITLNLSAAVASATTTNSETAGSATGTTADTDRAAESTSARSALDTASGAPAPSPTPTDGTRLLADAAGSSAPAS